MASRDNEHDLSSVWFRGKLRSAKDASELLEGLRTGYRALSPDRQQDVKALMSRIFESQRRSGVPLTITGQTSIAKQAN